MNLDEDEDEMARIWLRQNTKLARIGRTGPKCHGEFNAISDDESKKQKAIQWRKFHLPNLEGHGKLYAISENLFHSLRSNFALRFRI